MTLRAAACSALCSGLLSAFFPGFAEEPHRPPRKSTAEQLVADAEVSLVTVARIARENSGARFKPDNPRQQPFWSAVRKTETILKDIRACLKARDPRFFEAVNSSTQSLARLKSAYVRSGIDDPSTEHALKTLSNALSLLRSNYGRESKSLGRDGALTLDEKGDFERLKAREQILVEQLKTLRSQVLDSPRMTADLDRQIARLRKSIDAPDTARAFRSALETVDIVEGEWEALSYFVEPRFREIWNAAGTADSFHAMDKISGRATAANTVAWDELDTPVESTAETRPAAEVEIKPEDLAANEQWLEDTLVLTELSAYYQAVQEGTLTQEAAKELMDELNPDDENK